MVVMKVCRSDLQLCHTPVTAFTPMPYSPWVAPSQWLSTMWETESGHSSKEQSFLWSPHWPGQDFPKAVLELKALSTQSPSSLLAFLRHLPAFSFSVAPSSSTSISSNEYSHHYQGWKFCWENKNFNITILWKERFKVSFTSTLVARPG